MISWLGNYFFLIKLYLILIFFWGYIDPFAALQELLVSRERERELEESRWRTTARSGSSGSPAAWPTKDAAPGVKVSAATKPRADRGSGSELIGAWLARRWTFSTPGTSAAATWTWRAHICPLFSTRCRARAATKLLLESRYLLVCFWDF